MSNANEYPFQMTTLYNVTSQNKIETYTSRNL